MLASALELVSATEPSASGSPPTNNAEGLAETFAKFFDTTWTVDCQNFFADKRNPYVHATYWESRPHSEGIAAWREYYARLPEKCNPKPYDMAIADGKTKEEAEKDQAAYAKLQVLVVLHPAIVKSYLQPIETGKTPGQAYCHWVRNRKLWGEHEWQPEADALI